MKSPAHPGRFLLLEYIEPSGLSIAQAAAAMGVQRVKLWRVVRKNQRLSAEMAVRISQVFGGSPEEWLTQQLYYELAQVRRNRIRLHRLEPVNEHGAAAHGD